MLAFLPTWEREEGIGRCCAEACGGVAEPEMTLKPDGISSALLWVWMLEGADGVPDLLGNFEDTAGEGLHALPLTSSRSHFAKKVAGTPMMIPVALVCSKP